MILDRNWDKAKNVNGGMAINCWWGMDAGVIDVKIDSSLNWIQQKDMRIWKRLLINNAWNPFEGELRSQNGEIRPDSTDRLPSEEIIAMDWLNHNVVGTIPLVTELNEEMRQLTNTSGIKGTQEV